MKSILLIVICSAGLFAEETLEKLLLNIYMPGHRVMETLPDELPDLGFADTEFVGAIESRGSHVVVFLVLTDRTTLHRRWQDELYALGWTDTYMRRRETRGFLAVAPDVIDQLHQTYCSEAGDRNLAIQFARYEATSFAYISLSDHASACGKSEKAREREYAEFTEVVPNLAPPAESTIKGRGVGGGGDERHISANIVSDLSAAEIVGHYNQELVQGGWRLIETSGRQDKRWSLLSFKDDDDRDWMGTLILTPTVAKIHFCSFVMVRIPN